MTKLTVEQCNSISTRWLREHGYFCSYQMGNIGWLNRFGELAGSVGFFIFTGVEERYPCINFKYTITNQYGKETEHNYRVTLDSTPCYFGGRRWWFLCPMNVCRRRVGALYLVREDFRCRHCYNLTYKSCQDNHKFDSFFWSMGVSPKLGKKLFDREIDDNELNKCLDYLKALLPNTHEN